MNKTKEHVKILKIRRTTMNKIKPNQKRDLKIFIFGYLFTSLVSYFYFKTGWPLLFVAALYAVFIFILKYLFEYIKYSSIIFTPNGVRFRTLKGMDVVEWNDMVIEILKKNKHQLKLKIKSPTFNHNLYIDYLTIESTIELTKKYCPKDHEFYKAVEEYSKNKNLPF